MFLAKFWICLCYSFMCLQNLSDSLIIVYTVSRNFYRKALRWIRYWKAFRDKDIADLTVDNNDVNTSLNGTINKFSCWPLQCNIILDEEIPIAPILTTPPKGIQSNKHNGNYFDDYIASSKSLKLDHSKVKLSFWGMNWPRKTI